MGGKKKKPGRQKTKNTPGSSSKQGSFVDTKGAADQSQDEILVSQYSSENKDAEKSPLPTKLEESKSAEEAPVVEKQVKEETPKSESALKEEEDQSTSVVITKDQQQPAVVDDHLGASPTQGRKKPNLAVGIEKLKLSDRLQSEDVQSPMKLKKTQLANLQTNTFEMKPQNVITKQNATLQEQFAQVQRNFEAKQSLFAELQRLPDAELEKMYNSGQLKNVKETWAKELEVKFEPANEEENGQLVAFNNENKQFFDKIEEFMHILEDWADEHLHFENGQKVKPKRPPKMGIERFKNAEPTVEIESPFRKKKTHLQRLDFSHEKLQSCEQVGESKEIQNKLQELFKTVMSNFQKRKDEFEQLKAKPVADLANMYNSGELLKINKNWQKELELQYMGDEQANVEHTGQAISEFMNENQSSFKEIEAFLTIVGDWVDETSAAILSSGSNSKDSISAFEGGQKAESSKEIKKATEEAYARIQIKNQAENMAKEYIVQKREDEKQQINELATDIDALQKIESYELKRDKDDAKLLNDMEELKATEIKQLEEKRAQFTPRNPSESVQTQPKQESKDETKQIDEKPLVKAKEIDDDQKGDGSGINPTVVIVCALAVAGICVLAKQFYSK